MGLCGNLQPNVVLVNAWDNAKNIIPGSVLGNMDEKIFQSMVWFKTTKED